MIIQINDKYRIVSNASCWEVQQYKGKRKDTAAEKWEALYFCVDFRNALVALAELQIRRIDSSVPEEIKAAIRKIRDECLTASELFRELAV